MARHLVVDTKLKLLTMPMVTLTPTQTLAAITLSQLEYKTIIIIIIFNISIALFTIEDQKRITGTRAQSWLVPTTSHLMRWRCFSLTESQEVWTKNKHQGSRAYFNVYSMVVVNRQCNI